MRSDSHLHVKLGCCVVSSRDSESCLFLLRHVQNSSWKWPEDSHMDIMPAFHYSFNFCICRICYRPEDTNRWRAVSFLCTLFLSCSLSLPRCLNFYHPEFLWQSQLKRRHWSGHRLGAPYLNRNFFNQLVCNCKMCNFFPFCILPKKSNRAALSLSLSLSLSLPFDPTTLCVCGPTDPHFSIVRLKSVVGLRKRQLSLSLLGVSHHHSDQAI